MYFVKTKNTVEDVIKKSKFIGYIVPCTHSNAIIESLKRIISEHPHASHVAFAYRLYTQTGLKTQYSDAGEPSGTAGKPILKHLEGNELVNCLIAVVRYFGGTKLGTGGLTRAYGGTAKQAIEASTLYSFVIRKTIELKIEYKQLRKLEYRLKQLDGECTQKNFSEGVRLSISIPEKHVDTLMREFEST